MPRNFHGYEPDGLDCAAIVSAIGDDFGQLATIGVTFSLDEVIVIVRCRRLVPEKENPVTVQALCRRPIKHAGSAWVMQYSALLDCWHQLDRGVLAASARPIERGWNGRPHTPRRRT